MKFSVRLLEACSDSVVYLDGLGKGGVRPSGNKEGEQTLVVSGRAKIIRKTMVGPMLRKGNCENKTNRGENDKNIFPLWWAESLRERLVF